MDVHLKNLFARFHEQFGSGPGLGPGSGTCLMKVEGIAPPFIKSIYRAAGALYRTDPWKRLRPGHLFGLRVGKDSDWSGKKQPFPCVQFVGGDGGDLGFHMFRSENDARRTTGSRETIRVPNVELLRVTYELESLMFPSNKKMIRSLSLEVSGTDRFPVIDVARCSWGGLDDDEYPRDSPFHNHLGDGISSPILLSGWSEYYNLRSLPMSSPVADILSHPLTIYYILTALNISSKNLLLKGKEVILHYLGPEGELDWMPAFAEIGHLLNGMSNIQIVMVGPGVPMNLSGTTSGISSRVRVNLVRGLYQEEATYLSSPHVVIALNCGLEKYASWGGALNLIKSMGVPAFFTDQSEISCANAKQVLRSAGLHITQPVTPNPFRSPVRNNGPSSNLPSHSNGFVFGVNT